MRWVQVPQVAGAGAEGSSGFSGALLPLCKAPHVPGNQASTTSGSSSEDGLGEDGAGSAGMLGPCGPGPCCLGGREGPGPGEEPSWQLRF